MKSKFVKISLWLFLLGALTGCYKYDTIEEETSIYVNRQSLSLFVGEQIQLIASPLVDTYNWSSENREVATVTSSGLVQVVGEGTTDIVVSNGELSTKVPLTAITRIPIEDVSITQTQIELLRGTKRSISVTLLPHNANDVPKSYSWHSENKDIATVSKEGEISAISAGVTNIVYTIGEIVKKIKVEVVNTLPFGGPHNLSDAAPFELAAAKFDIGGEGYAFHDAEAGNSIGNDNYRRNNGDTGSMPVEVEGDNGYNIGYTNAGEWLLYTLNVVDAGNYKVDVMLACPSESSFHLEVDGVNVTGTIPTPATGGWGAYQLVTTPEDKLTLTLTAGKHLFKYYFEGGHNLRGFRFTKNN